MTIHRMNGHISSVLFDLDGTLHEDSVAVPLLVDAAAEHGYQLRPDSIVQGELFKPRLQVELGVSEAQAEAIYAAYVRLYHERAASRVRARTGAEQLVGELRTAGMRLALVTHKVESLARAVLAGLGLSEHFDVVLGHDSCAFRKPDGRVAHEALGRIAGSPGTAAIVGDSPADMECGAGAGLAMVVGVLGSVREDELRAAGATHICADLAEVERILVPAGKPGLP
ncbi:MAG: HAD family hydrolase [Dehalococcoidia bacterium]